MATCPDKDLAEAKQERDRFTLVSPMGIRQLYSTAAVLFGANQVGCKGGGIGGHAAEVPRQQIRLLTSTLTQPPVLPAYSTHAWGPKTPSIVANAETPSCYTQ